MGKLLDKVVFEQRSAGGEGMSEEYQGTISAGEKPLRQGQVWHKIK